MPVVTKLLLVAVVCAGLCACASRAPEVADAKAKAQKECLRETGSRIKRKDEDGCLDAPGRVITAEEIQDSGAATVGEAIDRLGR